MTTPADEGKRNPTDANGSNENENLTSVTIPADDLFRLIKHMKRSALVSRITMMVMVLLDTKIPASKRIKKALLALFLDRDPQRADEDVQAGIRSTSDTES